MRGSTRWSMGKVAAFLLLAAVADANIAAGQPTVMVTARVSRDSRITRTDTLAAWLSVTISGIPEVAVPGLVMTDAFVTDSSGRAYRVMSVGYRVGPHTGPQPGSQLVSYRRPERSGDPILMFRVRPGNTHYELRLPGMTPVPFDAWVMGHPRQ